MKVKVFKSEKISLLFSLEDLKEQIDYCFSEYDFLLFAISPKYHYEDINFYIKKIFNTSNYAAFHSVDSFCDSNIIEGIVVAVFKFEKNGNVNSFYIEDIGEDSSLARTADYLRNNTDKLHIIIGGLGNKSDLGTFLENLSTMLDYSPVNNLIGGISSGFEKDGETLTFQFIDGKIIKNGFFILSFENVDFSIGIALGFKPYGITYQIKKAEGRKLYTVDDNKSFVKVVNGILNGIENPDIRYLWYCPIYILDDKEGYVATLRTFSNIKDDYVEFYLPVYENQYFKLSFATPKEILEEDKKVACETKEKLKHPEIIFNFSCIARQYILEEQQMEEINIYTSVLNSHLFGFFTFGEIGPDKKYKKLKLYNETSLLLTMREK